VLLGFTDLLQRIMGCKASAEKKEPPEPVGDAFTASVLPCLWTNLCTAHAGDEEMLDIEWRSGINTVGTFIAREKHQPNGAVRDQMRAIVADSVDADHRDMAMKAIDDFTIDVIDERLYKLVSEWREATSDGGCDVLSHDEASHLLSRMEVGIDADAPEKMSFADVVDNFVRWTDTRSMHKIFSTVAHGDQVMTAAALVEFLSVSDDVVTTPVAEEMISHRLGGALTYRRFSSYFGSAATNSVIDPQRAGHVWQDMSRPLPSYSVFTQAVRTLEATKRALAEGTRAFILDATEGPDGVPFIGAELPLREFVEVIHAEGFLTNPFPVILIFPSKLPTALQTRVAELLTEVLGDDIARGLMFSGAIGEQSFSPSALKRKVLVMSAQAPLKPFVGLVVADMMRTGLGVRVTDVKGDTPAELSGIAKDDWLTHLNGEPIQSKQHLRTQLGHLRLGEHFTVRKSNLEDVQIVVGGAVDIAGSDFSKSFSDLVFLRMSDDDDRPASDDDDDFAPWDSRAVDANDLDDIVASPTVAHHFKFIKFHSHSSAATEEEEELTVGHADTCGAQFVDASSSHSASSWSKGKFVENARCGYVLRSPTVQEPTTAMHYKVSMLTTPSFGGSTESTVGASIYGSPSRPLPPRTDGVFEVDVTQPAVMLIRSDFSGTVYEAALPAHLLRRGYHALTLCQADNEKKRTVMCLVERTDEPTECRR
jgi:hypothetical protein